MFDEPAVVATLPNPRWLPEWLVHPGPVTPPGPTAWSTQRPDGLLADLLEQQRREPGAFERLERIGAWERVIAWAQANQLREMADHAHEEDRRCREEAERRALDRAAGLRVPPEVFAVDGVESAAAELALMLRCAPATATNRLSDALTLTGRFPATVSALHTGRITLSKARTIAEQTEQLSDAHAAAVEARVLTRAGNQTTGQLRQSVRRAVTRMDPAAVRRRHQAARADRGVRFWDLPDGMATVSACLPAAEALGVYGVLDECARRSADTCGAGNDATDGAATDGCTAAAGRRTLAARRADALVDLVCGIAGYTSEGTRCAERTLSGAARGRARSRRSRVQVQVRVTVPFSTLFGIDDQPGELAGYGPITADQARELAAEGTWRRILTDPATGAPTDIGTTAYRPPRSLREYVVTRSPECGFPPCGAAAHRGDLDHRIPYDAAAGTGPTCEHNLDPYCQCHHQLKHAPGWSVERGPGGGIVWTSPSGHQWSWEPPPVAEPVTPPPPGDPDEPPPF